MSTGKNKSYKGKTCVYCGVPKISNTGDHVVARQFVLERHRGNMPKVPACDACNGEKAKLEHHLTAVLPIGARHPDAAEMLTAIPKRLEKNPALRQSIDHTTIPRWMPSPSGLLIKTSVVLVDADALIPWSEMVVKGLAWHHWKVVVGKHREVIATIKSADEAAFFEHSLTREGITIPNTVLGNGALTYMAQGVEGHLPASIWRLSVYGVELGGVDPRFRTTAMYVVVDHDGAERRGETVSSDDIGMDEWRGLMRPKI